MVCCSGKVKTDKPKNRLVRANKYFVMRIFISLIIRTIRKIYFIKPENHFVKPKNDNVQGCFLRQKTPFKCIWRDVVHYTFRQLNGMTFTPSGRVYAILPPVKTIKRSGSRNGTCFSPLLYSRTRRLISRRCSAPSSISRLPSLHSIKAYLPSSKCNTRSASRPYRSR